MNILERHQRLRRVGQALLDNETVADEDRQFIGQALLNIGSGNDASDELQTKATKGEDSYKTARKRDVRDKLMFGWLEAAMAPMDEGGLGLTKKQAIKKLKESKNGQVWFPVSEETIDRYLRKYPEKRQLIFNLD